MSKQIAETTNQLHCIVDEDDNVLADGLTLFEAERQLTIFLNHGEDCYIGDSELQTIRGTYVGEE